MGKVVKTVLKVAAVAAVAYFAPPLAAKIGASVGITSALGTTALAAGIGAGAGKLIPGVTTTQGMFAGLTSGAGKTGLLGGTSPTATAATGAGTPTAAPLATSGGTGVGAGITAAENAFLTQAGGSYVPAAASAAPQTLGAALSSAAANPTRVITQGLGNITSGLGAALGGATVGGVNLGAVAPQLLAAGLAGSPGGAVAKAQEAELARAQQVNAALTQQRLDQANQLFNEAAYYDPEYIARQAAEAAMIKGGIETAKQTRGLTGERLAAERRRMALDTSRTAGTAYQQGYGAGVEGRAKARTVGLQALPGQYPTTSAENAINAANAAREAKAAEAQKLGDLFNLALGGRAESQLGV